MNSRKGVLRKAIVGLLLALSIGLPAQAQIRIGLSGTSDSTKSGTFVWAEAFVAKLEELGLEARIYPSSSLGNEIVRTEQVLLGLLEVNITGTQEVEMLAELFKGLELPFLIATNDELTELIEHTDFLDRINHSTQQHGMRVVGFAYTGGMEGLFTVGQPVRQPSDLAELRLRAMSSQQIAYFEAWGGGATQVAWEEVPQALQTGIADGYLNPPIVAVMFGHGGQLDFFTDLRTSPSMRTVVMSNDWFEGLGSAEQDAVKAAVRYASSVNQEWNKRTQLIEFDLLESIGINVIELSDNERERFRERLLPLWPTMASVEIREEIQALLETARVRK